MTRAIASITPVVIPVRAVGTMIDKSPLAPCVKIATNSPLYERLEDFRRLRDELDPRRAFVTEWLRDYVLGDA